MMVTIGAPAATTSPCRAAHTSTLPLIGDTICAYPSSTLRLFRQRAGIGRIGAGLVHRPRRNLGQQLMRARLAKIGLRRSKILARRIHRGLAPPAGAVTISSRVCCAHQFPAAASATARLVSAC